MTSDQVFRQLSRLVDFVGEPLMEGQKLLDRHPIASFEDMPRLAEQLGIAVSYRAGMPTAGSSFLSRGRRYIVVDTLQPQEHRVFTLAHEIGHHELHHRRCSSKTVEREEFEAHLFAIGLLIRTSQGKPLEGYLSRNPEAALALMGSGILVGGMFLVGVALKLFEWLSRRPPRMESS